MKLSCGDFVLTLGPQLKIKKNTFQGIIIPLSANVHSVPKIIQHLLHDLPRLRHFHQFTQAFRIQCNNNLEAEEAVDIANHFKIADLQNNEYEQIFQGRRATRSPVNPCIVEYSCDGGGVQSSGDRILHLLQRWEVEDIFVVVGRQDDSLSSVLIGAEIFSLIVESAKQAIEEHFIKGSQALSNTIQTKSVSPSNLSETITTAPVLSPAICMMDSTSIPSWPCHHHPTSDGGGRKSKKQGCINHFLWERKQKKQPPLHKINGTTPERKENAAEIAILAAQNEGDVLHIAEGLPWLKISKFEFTKLRNTHIPVKPIHYLCMCLAILIDGLTTKSSTINKSPRLKVKKYTPSSLSWLKCKELLNQSSYWSKPLQKLHGSDLLKEQVLAIREIIQEPTFTDANLIRTSSAAVKLYSWIQTLINEYDEYQLGILDSDCAANANLPEMCLRLDSNDRTDNKIKSDSGARRGNQTDINSNSNSVPPQEAQYNISSLPDIASQCRSGTRKIIDHGRLFHWSPKKENNA